MDNPDSVRATLRDVLARMELIERRMARIEENMARPGAELPGQDPAPDAPAPKGERADVAERSE